MSQVTVVSSTQLAADAGFEVVHWGGNAVDAAVAASLVSMSTEPGVCAPGAGGYVTVWPADADPVTLDGNVLMPGKGLPATAAGRGCRTVRLEYGGGVETVVGPGSVAVPAGIAALAAAAQRYGRLAWEALVAPAEKLAREGFPLSPASYGYLQYSGEPIFGHSPDGRRALFHGDGRLKQPGEHVVVPYLADSLAALGREGPESFYTGDLARAMAAYVQAEDGLLSLADLADCHAEPRRSLQIGLEDWEIAVNPPPAIGGATLAAMLIELRSLDIAGWGAEEVAAFAAIQAAVLSYRRERLDWSRDLEADTRRLLEACLDGRFGNQWRQSSSTVHSSAVDDDGLGCAITMSAGYGSGVMAPGTGIWLNNCIGELELNRRGFDVGPPGTRLPSNMAPTVARRRDGTVLAVGSPGADRITTALVQSLFNHLHLGMGLQEAVDHPRVHVEFTAAGPRLVCEPGLPLELVTMPTRVFAERSMFFGGVAAAQWDPLRGFTTGADPRRAGSHATGSGADIPCSGAEA